MSEDKPENKYYSRKFIVTAVAFVAATLLTLGDVITGSEWTNVTLACVAGYNVGNALATRR